MAYLNDLNVNDLCYASLRKVNGYMDNDSPEPWQLQDARHALNLIIDSDEAIGGKRFQRRIRSQAFEESSEVSSNSTYYRCYCPNTASADDEPGVGENWQAYWVEDTSITSASAWALATDYTSAGVFSLASDELYISNAIIVEDSESKGTLRIIASTEWMEIDDKSAEGEPEVLYVEFTDKDTTRARLWPIPDEVGADGLFMRKEVMTRVENIDSGTDDMPYTDNWARYLVWQLAADLAPEYECSLEKTINLERQSRHLKKTALSLDKPKLKKKGMRSCYAKRSYNS